MYWLQIPSISCVSWLSNVVDLSNIGQRFIKCSIFTVGSKAPRMFPLLLRVQADHFQGCLPKLIISFNAFLSIGCCCSTYKTRWFSLPQQVTILEILFIFLHRPGMRAGTSELCVGQWCNSLLTYDETKPMSLYLSSSLQQLIMIYH